MITPNGSRLSNQFDSEGNSAMGVRSWLLDVVLHLWHFGGMVPLSSEHLASIGLVGFSYIEHS